MHKLISVFFILMALLVCGIAQAMQINIREMGAVGDGTTLNTRTIQSALDSAAKLGGGTVYVPPGVYLTGALQLRTNVNLYLEGGSVLRGSANVNDYMLNGRRVGLLFTQDAENVSISGHGTIDGNGDSFMVLDTAKKMDHAGVMWSRQGDLFRHVSEGLGDGPLVP